MTKRNTITASALKKALSKGAVRFSFEKKDGTIREAYGTRNPDMIPVKDLPKGQESTTTAVNFYDLEKSEWRSVSIWAPVFA